MSIEGGPSHVERFFENMIVLSNFVCDLVTRVSTLMDQEGKDGIAPGGMPSPELVQFGTGLLQSYNRRDLIEGFIGHSKDHWDKIKECNEEFMQENAFLIFANLPSHHVDAFKNLLLLKDSNGNHLVDKIDRDTIWKFFHSFVKIAIKFIHDERKPYCRNGEFRYSVKYYPEIQLDSHAKKWNVKLPFPQKT